MLLLRETMQVDPCNYDNAQSSNQGNTQYSSLNVNTRLSEPKVKESSKVIGERVNRRVEEVWDPELGRHVFRTVEYVEKIVETEVYTLRIDMCCCTQFCNGLVDHFTIFSSCS